VFFFFNLSLEKKKVQFYESKDYSSSFATHNEAKKEIVTSVKYGSTI